MGQVEIDAGNLEEVNKHFGTKAIDSSQAGHCNTEYTYFDKFGGDVLMLLPASSQ